MYCVMCIDKPDSAAVRLENRPAHLQYAGGLDYVQLGGPLMSDDGETMIGSLLFLNVDTRQAAQGYVDNDPYFKAGLFDEIKIFRFHHLIGEMAAPRG